MKSTKKALFMSCLSLLLCVSMLVGTTFAWFTDSVTSGTNQIIAGNLDVELEHQDKNQTAFSAVDAGTKLFDDVDPELWEPGAVAYENLRVSNLGTLALRYQLSLTVANETKVEKNGAERGLSQALKVAVVEDGVSTTATRDEVIAAVSSDAWAPLASFTKTGELLAKGAEETDNPAEVYGIVIYWEPTDHDNDFNMNNDKQGEKLTLDLGVTLIAGQMEHEIDSFDKDYDKTAFVPVEANTQAELTTAIAEAPVGATIQLSGDIELATNMNINKDIVIDGGGSAVISKQPVYVGADNEVTFKGMNFEDTTGGEKTSTIYGTGFKGTMVFDGCTFGDNNWEAIQITPAGDCEIIIKNCTFTAANAMKRFIHIQPGNGNTFKVNITVVNNTFIGCENVNYGTSGNNLGTVADFDYIAPGSTLTLGGNVYKNTDGSTSTGLNPYFCNSPYSYEIVGNDLLNMLTSPVATYQVTATGLN